MPSEPHTPESKPRPTRINGRKRGEGGPPLHRSGDLAALSAASRHYAKTHDDRRSHGTASQWLIAVIAALLVGLATAFLLPSAHICAASLRFAALPTAVQRQLWDRLHELATGLWMHVKTQDTPAVFHGSSTLIAGAHAIHERLGSQLLSIEPQTFLQVNPLQMERLYALVREFAALQGHEVILDLYSGAGAIALQLAAHCAQVYAVEVNRQASLLAMQQARVQGVENCQFRTGKVERILFRYMAQGLHADLAILDPPRAGCRPEALRALALMGVPRLIYISCSPPTLARDLRLLHDLGYRTAGIYPFDMFPQTYHIECVATLDRVV